MLGVNWFNWEWAKSGGWRRCAGTGRLIWKQTQIQWRFLKGNETTASGGFVAEHLRNSEEKWKLRDYHKRRRVLLPFWDRKCDCVRKIEAVDPQFGLRFSVICYGGDGGAHGAEKGRNSLSFFSAIRLQTRRRIDSSHVFCFIILTFSKRGPQTNGVYFLSMLFKLCQQLIPCAL